MEIDIPDAPRAPAPSGPGVSNAAGVRWDLSWIRSDATAAREALRQTLADATAFEQTYRGRLGGLSAPGLATALDRLAGIYTAQARTAGYAFLRLATDAVDTGSRDLENSVELASIQIANATRFVELEWPRVTGATAQSLGSAPELARHRHFLEQLSTRAPHLLSQAEERMLAEREPLASAWAQLFDRETSALQVSFDAGAGPEPHTIDRLLAHLRNPDRDLRHRALDALYPALGERSPVLAACYDALVGDRLVSDRLRGYATPMQAANLDNELDDAVVDQLVSSVQARYPLAQRWFRTKAGLLGLPKLDLADQYAPLGAARPVPFGEGWKLVHEAMRGFSGRVAAIFDAFLRERRIDAEPRANKRGGAFCTHVAQDAKPVMLLNYTDTMNDVATLAHEYGHGLHFTLAGERQTELEMGTGMALAEIASTFNEMLLFDHLLAREKDPSTRRALISERVESSFATVFRQVMMTAYERRAYALKADGQALTDDRLSRIWIEENQRYYGDSMELPDGYRLGWSYVPHFLHTRFYTYSYAFAHLASLALYARYRQTGQAFVGPYLEFLAAGGSQSPRELLGRLGIDITDPHWVDAGFAELERLVVLAEKS